MIAIRGTDCGDYCSDKFTGKSITTVLVNALERSVTMLGGFPELFCK